MNAKGRAGRVCLAASAALAALAALAAFAAFTALAAGAPLPSPTALPAARVTVGTRTVATLRAEVLGKSPQERAREATRILDEIVRGGSWGEVHVRTDPGGRILLVGTRGVFALVPGDTDAAAGETLDAAVEGTVRELNRAFSEAEERRSRRTLLPAILTSVAATLFVAALVAGLRLAKRFLEAKLVALAGRLNDRLQAGGRGFVPLLWVTRGVRWIVRGLFLVAALVAAYLWLAFVLRQFPYTRAWGEGLGRLLASAATALGLGVLRQLPNLAIVAFIAFVTRLLGKLSAALFDAIESGRLRVSAAVAETTKPTRRIVTGVLWVFALIMAYPYLPGSGTDAFKGVSVVLGVMISLGSTTIVGQVFSGFMLLYARVFKVGDFVRIGDVEGTIQSQGVFVTKVTTPWDDELAIPNSVVASATLRNYSRSTAPGGPLLATRVTIGYDAPWRQVEALLLLAADRTAGLKKEPHPFVRHWSLSDFYVEYELNAPIERPVDRVAVLTALHANVQDAFNEHGVQIMSPHYLGDPDSPKVVPPARWYPAPAKRPTDDGRAG